MANFKVGQPIKYTQAKRVSLLKALEKYIDSEEYPTMPKFCVLHGISKQRVYEWAKDKSLNSEGRECYPLGEYFAELIKRMNDKQESFIEEHAVQGHITPSFAIFKLKQPGIGWTDKTDLGVTGDMKIAIGLPPEFKSHGN